MTVSTRTVVMVAALALLAGWFGASVTQNVSRGQAAPVSRTVKPIGTTAVTPPTAEKLRERKSDTPVPQRGRNPFVYGSRLPRPSTVRDREPGERAVAMEPVDTPVMPPAPLFRLAGIASDVKDGVTVLTAILNDNGSIVFVKGGEKLSNGYSVVRVEELSVTLIDAQGVTQTIKLP
jgi:hypothetical protein